MDISGLSPTVYDSNRYKIDIIKSYSCDDMWLTKANFYTCVSLVSYNNFDFKKNYQSAVWTC